MDEENVSMPAAKLNSTMENRLVSMKHKFETAKLRDLLREVTFNSLGFDVIYGIYAFAIHI